MRSAQALLLVSMATACSDSTDYSVEFHAISTEQTARCDPTFQIDGSTERIQFDGQQYRICNGDTCPPWIRLSETDTGLVARESHFKSEYISPSQGSTCYGQWRLHRLTVSPTRLRIDIEDYTHIYLGGACRYPTEADIVPGTCDRADLILAISHVVDQI